MSTTPNHSLAIVGVGNPLRRDDAVGILVARAVYDQIADPERTALLETPVGGLELTELLHGYESAVIIDAIQTGSAPPGTVYEYDTPDCRPSEMPAMTHQVGLLDGLELARRLGVVVPQSLVIYAIEVEDAYTFGAELTDSVKRAIPRAVAGIVSRVSHQLSSARTVP